MDDQYNFTSGMGVPEEKPIGGVRGFIKGVAGAYNRAGQLSQERRVPNNDLERQTMIQRLEQTRWTMHEKATSMQLETKAREGIAEMNGIMAESLGPNANPDEILRRLYDTGSRYAIPPEQFDSFIKTAEFMKQRREFANRFAGGTPRVGSNQSVTTKFKDPLTGAEYTVQDKPDQTTPNIIELQQADKLDGIASQLDEMGMSDKAQGLRDNASRLRKGVERVDQRENSLNRQLDTAEVDLAGLKALAAEKGPNHKIQTLGQSVSAAIVQKEAEVKGLRKRIGERNADDGSAPKGSPVDPLGLFPE